MRLDGKNVMITGGAQGIGLALAELVLELGGCVTLLDLNPEKLRAVVEALNPDRALSLCGSVTNPEFIEQAVQQSVAKFGAIHALANNAGITNTAMIEKMTLQQWQQVIDVNLTGAFLTLQAVGRHMVGAVRSAAQPGGAIVNVTSDAGRKGTIGQVNYSAAKAGLLGMTMSAAREWGRYGVRVNSVSFGVVETQMTETVRGEKFRDQYLAAIPLGRFLQPREAASSIVFLLSAASMGVTGQHLSVNGGSYMSA